MHCAKCGREGEYFRAPKAPGMYVMMSGNHADAERYMYYCPGCKKPFCGQCCFPKWQALKAKEGLTGPALAAKLERDPDAFFSEDPKCPDCKTLCPYEGPATGRCFIATAACGAGQAEDVIRLSAFRETVLRRTFFGRVFISVYEFLSPPLARFITCSEERRFWVRRWVVRPARFVAERCLQPTVRNDGGKFSDSLTKRLS